jgi:hypothetical protein
VIDAKWTSVASDKILADLAAFWINPPPGRYSHQVPRRIAGSEHDQAVPEGTVNPYWEIVRQMPVDDIGWKHYRTYAPDAHYFTPGEPMRTLTDRNYLCVAFGWAIPSPGDITWMRKRLKGAGVVEIGAGSGYWAWQLAQAGTDVAAYEPEAPESNTYVATKPWFPVQHGNHEAAGAHPDRSLLLCWPSYGEPWASWALSAYAGDQLFYAGESWGGCCADDAFFGQLEKEWDEVGSSPHHVTFSGIHCSLTEYRRKEEPS